MKLLSLTLNKTITNMRNEKELLQLMLRHQEYFSLGLCSWICNILIFEKIITKEECRLLLDYIEKNRPSIYSSIDAYKNRGRHFYWKEGNINPRIKWINKHIKKLSK